MSSLIGFGTGRVEAEEGSNSGVIEIGLFCGGELEVETVAD